MPEDVELTRAEREALDGLDQAVEAEIAVYRQVLRLAPGETSLDYAIWFHRGVSAARRGDSSAAVLCFKRTLELNPDEPIGYWELAEQYAAGRKPRAAVLVLITLAERVAGARGWAAAIPAYERARAYAPDDREVLTALRDAYIKVGRMRDAAELSSHIQSLPAAPAEPAGPSKGAEKTEPPPKAAAPEPARPPKGAEKAEPPQRARAEPEPPQKGRGEPDGRRRQRGATPPPEPTPPPRAGREPAQADLRALKNRSLGEVLLALGLITEDQRRQALQIQGRTGGGLGRIFIDMGAIDERQLARGLAAQWGLEYVDLTGSSVDLDAARLVPQHLAQRHTLVPLAVRNKRLIVAIADPLNVMALDDVRLITGMEAEAVVAAPSDIQEALREAYRGEADLGEVLRLAGQFDLPTTPGDERAQAEDISLDRLRTMVEDAPVVRFVSAIVNGAIQDGASDIHIEPQRANVQVRYRIDGVLRDVMAAPRSLGPAVTSRIKIMANMDIAERRVPQDGQIHVKAETREYDLRVSTLPTLFGEKVVMRILDQSSVLRNMTQLGISAETMTQWEDLAAKPHGILLVSGPTGSGKTTTLYATLNKLNTTDKNIVTIEDPVEYQIARINQIHVNPKAGITFAKGLRSILRQDPDIVMVGEIRDKETAEIAIQASLTGHLVLSTIHTNDAPSTVTRLVDMGIEPFLIAASVIGVMAQRLARTICPHCKIAYTPPPDALRRLDLEDRDDVELYRGTGCDRCKRTGYRGRTAVNELLVMTDAIRALIVKGAPLADLREQGLAEGMRTLRMDGINKVLEGTITVEELLRVVFVEG